MIDLNSRDDSLLKSPYHTIRLVLSDRSTAFTFFLFFLVFLHTPEQREGEEKDRYYRRSTSPSQIRSQDLTYTFPWTKSTLPYLIPDVLLPNTENMTKQRCFAFPSSVI